MLNRDELQLLFRVRKSDSKEGLRIIGLFFSIDSFIDWLPAALDEFLPILNKLAQLLNATRAIVESASYAEYIREPLPDDNTGKLSNGASIRATIEASQAITSETRQIGRAHV